MMKMWILMMRMWTGVVAIITIHGRGELEHVDHSNMKISFSNPSSLVIVVVTCKDGDIKHSRQA